MVDKRLLRGWLQTWLVAQKFHSMVFMSMHFGISLLELFQHFSSMILGKKFNFSFYFFFKLIFIGV